MKKRPMSNVSLFYIKENGDLFLQIKNESVIQEFLKRESVTMYYHSTWISGNIYKRTKTGIILKDWYIE